MVVAAGTGATLAVFLVGLLEQAFQGDLRVLFGAGTDPESVVAASGWVVLTASLVAGAAAGVLSYLYLRRSGPSRLRWPAYLLAGAMPGLLVLAAEVVTRLGGARLFSLVSAASVSDELVLSYFHAARINRALIVLFVGALVAIFLLGRSLPSRPATDDPPSDDAPPTGSGPADPPPTSPADQPTSGDQRTSSADQLRQLRHVVPGQLLIHLAVRGQRRGHLGLPSRDRRGGWRPPRTRAPAR